GGRSARGVVAAASYEARRFGIRSAMPMRDALRRCPDLICQPSRMRVYQVVSREVFDLFRRFTPDVEGLSLDEAFLDLSASISLFGTPRSIGESLRAAVVETTGLTVSVGIAPNKLVAKIASDMDKPDGLTLIEPHEVNARLDPLPVRVLPGIGPKTLPRLQRARIRTVGDLRRASNGLLEPIFGKYAQRVQARAAGEDSRAVGERSRDRSISAEETFAEDTRDLGYLKRELLSLTERTAARVRARQWLAGTVQLKIRRDDFRTFTRQAALTPASAATDAIYGTARTLLSRWLAEHDAPVRLIGVGCTDFVEASQIDLFAEAPAQPASDLDRTVDSIRERFGGSALARARTLNRD
ncbi:MAG: DNA polymerase IV, partial [Pseudomonadota bacterium]